MADHDQQPAPEAEPAYDRFSPTQALSNRGYALWIMIPIVIPALGFAVVAIVAHNDSGGGLSVRLPISGGAADVANADDEQLVGQLEVDDRHCVYLRPSSGSPAQVWPVWPIGYHATLDGDHLTLVDRRGQTVATSGQLVTIAGGSTAATDYAGEPCLPEDGDVFVIGAPVTAVGG